MQKVSVLFILVQPNGLNMKVQKVVKEKENTSVECKANSANPADFVGMKFIIGNTKQSRITPQVTLTNGSDNGIAKSFVFTFTPNRKENGMIARCIMLWNGECIEERDDVLNITCE